MRCKVKLSFKIISVDTLMRDYRIKSKKKKEKKRFVRASISNYLKNIYKTNKKYKINRKTIQLFNITWQSMRLIELMNDFNDTSTHQGLGMAFQCMFIFTFFC